MSETSAPTEQQMRALWDECKAFVEAQKISCADAVYQSDRVIENAYGFIENVGEIVGWYEYDDD